mgnify:CR=1 FL=1
MGKVQLNVLIDETVKNKAAEMIRKLKKFNGQPVSLSELVETCLRWYCEADSKTEAYNATNEH